MKTGLIIKAMLVTGLATGNAYAQEALLLTNYTFSDQSRTIGNVVPAGPGTQLSKVKLTGPSAKFFSLNDQNQLQFRKAPAGADTWYDVGLEWRTPAGKKSQTFRVVKDQFIHNKVIAHRGAWKHTGAAQNSIGSLQHAIKLGCMGSEFDVHMSADSVLFVNHDPAYQGTFIEKTAASALTQIKLSNGEPMPTVIAYLQEGMKQNRTRLILEIKTSIISKERSLALAQKVVELVRQQKAQAWVEYIAFDYDVCKKVKSLDPYAKVAYLNGDKAPELLAQDGLDGLDYNHTVLKKNENWLAEARQKQLSTNVWTVNDPAAMDWFLAQQVDFITTDEPEALLGKATN
ncbi:hypothetical protein GCM10023189_20130 [Nibrella saemangeumensis]|uniref:GP-PDE domain-containing protein n=1 Tax=Nibrella saemangeumensis TaxID=1084526 RepID=A0ABP8MSF8_9BACT